MPVQSQQRFSTFSQQTDIKTRILHRLFRHRGDMLTTTQQKRIWEPYSDVSHQIPARWPFEGKPNPTPIISVSDYLFNGLFR